MSKGKSILLAVVALVIFFCISYVVTLKFVIEPRYDYLTQEGVTQKIEEMQGTIDGLNQQIITLEQQLEADNSVAEPEA